MPELQCYHKKKDKEKQTLDNRRSQDSTLDGLLEYCHEEVMEKFREEPTLGINLLQMVQSKCADLSYCITYTPAPDIVESIMNTLTKNSS